MTKKKIRKPKQRKPVKIWAVATSGILAFVIAANIVLSCTFLFDLVCLVLGGKRTVYAEGSCESSYTQTTSSKADATEQANTLVQEIAGEGIVLMKNADNALPLTAGARVSVFGKNSVNLVYSGSGSGGGDNSTAKTIFESLTAAGMEYNPALKEFYEDTGKSGSPRGENSNFSQDMAKFDTAETPWSSYTANGIPDSFADYSDAAIIVISRIGGEEFDLNNSELAARERHYLELDENEEELVRQVCAAGFGKVILVVNSANVMELGFVEQDTYGHIDACLWMGAPGNNGVMALGRILTGEINPSGHTVDTWMADVKTDPTYQNFGDNGTANGDRYSVDGKNKNYYFVDYEEGIYVGYRYWETAAYEASQGNYDGFVYEDQVVYPFGYGLSYTTFDWQLKDDTSLNGKTIEASGNYQITVTVTNTGSRAGKDVIQLYVSASYTPGGIEKAYKVLVGFVKTDLLQPGESKDYTLTVDPYDFASYDYSDANDNGFAGYELEGGSYTLFVSSNAHESVLEVPFSVDAAGIRYETDPDTGTAVTNQFEDADDQLGSLLSRADFAGTWPKTRTDEERAVTKDFISSLGVRDSGNPNEYTELPAQGVTGSETISFKDMVGLDWDDPKWDSFMDQLTVDELVTLINQGAFKTESIQRLDVPKTICSDGPVGFVAFMGSSAVYGTANYCCEVMMASTWNTELLAKVGASLAQEALWGNEDGDGMPYSAIYAPAANIHRSPFSGRNWEYFSEDGFLSGAMAAAEIKSARENGLAMFMKHFALNDQETHRNAHGLCTWANEQSIRELYLKPFETAVKDGGTVGIMSSFNRIGTKWTGGSYALLTQVLRNEWGFQGTVITDYSTDEYCDPLQMIYAGGDLNLTSTIFLDEYDANSAGDVSMLRRAAKNILYTVSRTNAMDGEIIGYKIPVWQEIMFIADGGIAVLLLLGLFLALRARKKQLDQNSVTVC